MSEISSERTEIRPVPRKARLEQMLDDKIVVQLSFDIVNPFGIVNLIVRGHLKISHIEC